MAHRLLSAPDDRRHDCLRVPAPDDNHYCSGRGSATGAAASGLRMTKRLPIEKNMQDEHLLFVTGKLAEKALRRVVAEVAAEHGFEYSIAVMPITVAALMTPRWIARHLTVEEQITRLVIPGYCSGDAERLERETGRPVERGPADLRELPQFFRRRARRIDYGEYDIEIVGMIDGAEQLSLKAISDRAMGMFHAGADVIGLGHDSTTHWPQGDKAVRSLRKAGHRVLLRSRDPDLITRAIAEGVEWVHPIEPSQVELLGDADVTPIVVPEIPGTWEGIGEFAAARAETGRRWVLDPVLAPIGFGFSQSLIRYYQARTTWPEVPLAMDLNPILRFSQVDSAGVLLLLLGLCQELSVRTVLVSQTANTARSAVRECDLIRRLAYCAVRQGINTWGLETRLAILRDPELLDNDALVADMRDRLKDPSPRIFVADSRLRVLMADRTLESEDPFDLFTQLMEAHREMDRPMPPEIAFYLGYEMSKATMARDLGKNYHQDEALNWGLLTVRELTRLERRYLRRVRKIDSDCLDDDPGS